MASIHKRQGPKGITWQVRERGKRGRNFDRRSDGLLYKAQLEAGIAEQSRGTTSTIGDPGEGRRPSRRAPRWPLAKEGSLAKPLEPLAARRVEELRASDVRTWVADLVDEGLSAETVSACLRLLRSVLDV